MNRGRVILDYMLDREGRPVDTFTLERLGGRRSWRTRISDARVMARLIRRDIVNSQQPVYKHGRLRRVDSFYTLVKVSRKRAA